MRSMWVRALSLVVLVGCAPRLEAAPPEDAGRDATSEPLDASPDRDAAAPDAAPESPADAGADAAQDAGVDAGPPPTCASTAECQNGSFCDGYELCAPGAPGADAFGCVPGEPPCGDGACDEEETRCATPECACTSEGLVSEGCEGGLACRQLRCAEGACVPGAVCPTPPPAAPCDSSASCDDGLFCNGITNCCGVTSPPPCGALTCDERTDTCSCTSNAQCSDGLYCTGVDRCELSTGRCLSPIAVCIAAGQRCLEGIDRCGTGCGADSDCSDGRACNGVERCRSGVCSAPLRCSTDLDGDGSASMETGGDDCDDGNRRRFPGNTEVCDVGDTDEDCDPTTYGQRDVDRDGAFDARCCNWGPRGDRLCGTDCDDIRADVHPGAAETCNFRDDDCDGAIDEGVTVQLHRDSDGDGSGDPGCASMGCAGARGFVMLGNDCDDARTSIRAGSTICAPDGSGVRTCEGGAWASRACPLGTTCRPQPDGSGLCL